MREVICIHVGQAGVQIGNSIWELFCAEHNINENGFFCFDPVIEQYTDTFFSELSTHKNVPRSLFIDLEPTCMDEIRKGSYKDLYHPDKLINGPEDSASNFARGFFTVGKLLLPSINQQLRKLLEDSNTTQAIMIFRSLGGGTGSGLTSAIFDTLVEYPKLHKVEFPIYPSPTLTSTIVEPYNSLLSEHFCMEDIDVSLLFDNEAMFDLCMQYAAIHKPTFTTINRLLSQIASSLTASMRFPSTLGWDLHVLQTNLVPYPRLHFPLANFAPISAGSKTCHDCNTILDITKMVFERENQLIKVDHAFGKFMTCSLFYRGDISPYYVYKALSAIKCSKTLEFVDWCPTGFKVGMNCSTPVFIPGSGFAPTTKNVAMLTNTSALAQAWQRLTHKFYLLYSKRCFVHWYVGEGMEECEFTESLYNISALVKDYEEATISTVDIENTDTANIKPDTTEKTEDQVDQVLDETQNNLQKSVFGPMEEIEEFSDSNLTKKDNSSQYKVFYNKNNNVSESSYNVIKTSDEYYIPEDAEEYLETAVESIDNQNAVSKENLYLEEETSHKSCQIEDTIGDQNNSNIYQTKNTKNFVSKKSICILTSKMISKTKITSITISEDCCISQNKER